MRSKWNIDVLVIMGLGLLVRLLLLPHADMVHADAMSRVMHADAWASNPHYIVSGVWGPMNNYAFGLANLLLGGKILGPQLFNILLAIATVYPLYWFTKLVFENRRGAIIAATMFVLTPIVIRNSFQALPAIPFTFFLVLSIYYLATYLKNKQIKYAIFAALALNFASGFRYEGWIVSFLLGVVLLINKEYKTFFLFGMVAAVFPVSWMLGGYIEHGDFLYSLNYSTEWGVKEAEVVDGFGKVTELNRIIFFPYSLMVIINPVSLVLLLITIGLSIRRKVLSKEQFLWLMLPVILLIIYSYKSATGALLLQHKYSVSIIALLLPFFALIPKHFSKRFNVILIVGFACTLPFSMWAGTVNWKDKLSFSESLSDAVHDLFVLTYHETEVLPKLADHTFESFVVDYMDNAEFTDGLIIDNMGWENTYFMAMHSKSTPFVTEVTLQNDPKQTALLNYLDNHPKGFIMYNTLGRLKPLFDGNGNTVWPKNSTRFLELTEVKNSQGLVLFKYEQQPNNPVTENGPSVLDFEENLHIITRRIKSDKYWLYGIKQQAFDKGIPLEQAIKDNAQYVLTTQ